MAFLARKRSGGSRTEGSAGGQLRPRWGGPWGCATSEVEVVDRWRRLRSLWRQLSALLVSVNTDHVLAVHHIPVSPFSSLLQLSIYSRLSPADPLGALSHGFLSGNCVCPPGSPRVGSGELGPSDHLQAPQGGKVPGPCLEHQLGSRGGTWPGCRRGGGRGDCPSQSSNSRRQALRGRHHSVGWCVCVYG